MSISLRDILRQMSTKAFPFKDNSHLIVVQYINKQLVTDDRANQINTELKKNIF